jgi:PAS domain S-box-containing protein
MLDSSPINLSEQAVPTTFDPMVPYKQSECHRSVRNPLHRLRDENRGKRLNDRLKNVMILERVDHSSDPALEIKYLRRCMNDLIGVLALPAFRRGREPLEILSTLVDSLIGMFALDFIYARVIDEAGGRPLEVLRVSPLHSKDEIAQSLDDWLSEDQIDLHSQTQRKIGDQDLSIFLMRMGIEFDLGFIVAGSQRWEFPEQSERLVLGVAANQTAALLQQALILSEQERAASELDRRVVERTRELAESNKELQLQAGLLQHLPVSAWTLKPDGTPDFVNQVWLDFAGQNLDFVRSHPEAWMAAIHPEDREIASRAFWDGVSSGQGFAVETRSLRAQDGTYRWHLQQAVVLRDEEGKVLRFVGTTTDIDEQKRTEEALHQAQADLAHISRVTTMGELAASLAHEITQPISAAITNAEVCQRKLGHDKPDLDEVRAAVTRIGRDTKRAAEIIARIHSQFERGALSREVIDVNEINRETVALLRGEAVRHNISVRTELAADLPQIIGDRVQLQQVAMNLIINSIEAMKNVDGIRELVIKSQRSENEQILVSVSDTGIGLPPQLTERIFDPFFTTKPHGTGMGLRLSRSIIESHGGHLWAVGSSGRGATFHLHLPAGILGHSSKP